MKYRIIVEILLDVFEEILSCFFGHDICGAFFVEHLQINGGVTKPIVGDEFNNCSYSV